MHFFWNHACNLTTRSLMTRTKQTARKSTGGQAANQRSKHKHGVEKTKKKKKSKDRKEHRSSTHGHQLPNPSPPLSPAHSGAEERLAVGRAAAAAAAAAAADAAVVAAAGSTSPPPPDPCSVPPIDPILCDVRMRAVLDVKEKPEDAHAANAICRKMLEVLHSGLKLLLLQPLQAKLASDVVVALVQPLIDQGPNLKKLLRQTMSGHVKKLSKIMNNVQTLCTRLATMLRPEQRWADKLSLQELGDTLCRFQIDLGGIPYDKHSRALHLNQLSFCGLLAQSLAANTVPAPAVSQTSIGNGSSNGHAEVPVSSGPVYERCVSVFNSFKGGASALSLDTLLYMLQLNAEQLAQHKADVASVLHARIMADMRVQAAGDGGVTAAGSLPCGIVAPHNSSSSSSSRHSQETSSHIVVPPKQLPCRPPAAPALRTDALVVNAATTSSVLLSQVAKEAAPAASSSSDWLHRDEARRASSASSALFTPSSNICSSSSSNSGRNAVTAVSAHESAHIDNHLNTSSSRNSSTQRAPASTSGDPSSSFPYSISNAGDDVSKASSSDITLPHAPSSHPVICDGRAPLLQRCCWFLACGMKKKNVLFCRSLSAIPLLPAAPLHVLTLVPLPASIPPPSCSSHLPAEE